jgi:predicted ATPase/DNA-binding SARP family transcriptional activator
MQVKTLDKPVTGFKSNKVRGLLVYLSMEADRPHSRESLAGLLWPEWPNSEALGNLRYALSDLRRAIGDRTADPPYLLIHRDRLQFNAASDYWLDVAAFTQGVSGDKANPSFLQNLEKALEIYQGSFMEGFSLEDSPAFEDWALMTRERLARQASEGLHTLAEAYEHRGVHEKASSYAWRQLEIEPWDETSHQRIMRIQALTGQRSAALAQYETCKNLLEDELGVAPAEETTRLYEAIRDGKLKTQRPSPLGRVRPSSGPPSFLLEGPASDERPVFVAREQELNQLRESLEKTLAGEGRVVFVTGEAGSGKTALIGEFLHQVQETHETLVVASGDCNAYTGVGDPYLPFREILELLTGDVEARWAAGAISREHAMRLWNMLPLATQALVEAGPDLIDTFIQRATLVERASNHSAGPAEWFARLEEYLEHKPSTALNPATLHQVDLSEQYTRVLQTLEQVHPLVLVIDDLQWADAGSINLLFHLGRRLAGSHILILGAYRSEEIALGRDGMRHPLEPVINELRRTYGDILINLGQALQKSDSRAFLDALVDSEPNQFDEPFREMLYQQTLGLPLFTIELLRGLQERGDLTKDGQGRWITGPSLDWETLPARVEAAIQERIDRLPESLQKVLEVASVEGELFTAEVVARVHDSDAGKMLENLSKELDRKHRLVRAQSIQRLGGQLLSRYQFRHILFQKYLYSSLDEIVRAHLHEQVGRALEELYVTQEDVAANALLLARHFEQARISEKAIYYLHEAGYWAVRLSAFQDGIAHLSRGVKLLETLSDSPERDQLELDLQLTLAIAWQGAEGAQASKVENILTKARNLCEQIGTPAQTVQVLGGLAVLYYVRADYHRAREHAEEALQVAEKTGDPLLETLCHWYLGFIHFILGEFTKTREHLSHVTEFYNPQQHHPKLVYLRGSDAGLGALAYDACNLWCLGFPDQAEERSQQALDLAREIAHPFSLADVLCFAGCMLKSIQRDGEGLLRDAEELIELSHERNLAGWLATGTRYRGEALFMLGQIEAGVAEMQKGLSAMESEDVYLYFSGTLYSLAEAQAKAGQEDEGLATLEKAFSMVERLDERQWEAELHRLKGEILLMKGEEGAAEDCLQRAVEVARAQQAKSLELRAVMSLCRLWEKQEKKKPACRMLEGIYNWFTEGFDTPDLVQAKSLLEQLSA